MMVRTFLSIPGTNLMTAIYHANESFGIEQPPEVAQASLEAQNQASLEQLGAMLRGVSK